MARVIFIGLESSGKTATFYNIIREKCYMNTQETVGINTSMITIRGSGCKSPKISITLVDLGGSEKIRNMWSSQFFDTSAALYFVRNPATLDLSIHLLTNILVTTSFPLYIIVNRMEDNVASEMEMAIKVLLDKYSTTRSLLSCSICDISIKYRKNKPLQTILQKLGLVANRYYITHREEIILQQKNALVNSFQLMLSVDERKQKLLELRQRSSTVTTTDTNNQDKMELGTKGEIQTLTPTIFTDPP